MESKIFQSLYAPESLSVIEAIGDIDEKLRQELLRLED